MPTHPATRGRTPSGRARRGRDSPRATTSTVPPHPFRTCTANSSGPLSPALVVDLGSGTGLSTAVWADRARRVIGIESLAPVRRAVEVRCALPHASFRDGSAKATGLSDGAADIVTCTQSLHWMEPTSTFTGVARILRPGGVF